MLGWLKRFEKQAKFTQEEAWLVFKLAALAEAFGWTCLLIALILQKITIYGTWYAIPIAGQIHGTFFVSYFIILLATYPSMKWKRTTFLYGVLAGIFPYGSLIFELMHSPIKDKYQKIYLKIHVNTKVVLGQLAADGSWSLPFLAANKVVDSSAMMEYYKSFTKDTVPSLTESDNQSVPLFEANISEKDLTLNKALKDNPLFEQLYLVEIKRAEKLLDSKL